MLEDVSSQAAPTTLECFMYQVCMLSVPLDLFHMLSKFPKKKFFLEKISRSSFIYLITQNISFSNFPIVRLTFPINFR